MMRIAVLRADGPTGRHLTGHDPGGSEEQASRAGVKSK